MKRQTCAKQHMNKQCKSQKPCLPEPCPQDDCQCEMQDVPPMCPPCPAEENTLRICGQVTCRGNAVHMATVVIIHNRQVVAECITNKEGKYEFKGKIKPYCLRAHKGNRRSRMKNITNPKREKYQIDFCLI